MKHQQLFKCIVIDDEAEARYIMDQLLKQLPEAELVTSAYDAQSGLAAIKLHKPDLVFLDIKMPGMTGLDVVVELQKLQIKTHVVFVTAYDHYAIEAIKLAAFDYLLKPVDPVQLKAVFDKKGTELSQKVQFSDRLSMLLQQLHHPERLRFNTRNGFFLVEPAEIILVKAEGNYSEILLIDNKKEMATVNIGQIGEMLDKALFFRASRSILININYVRRLDRKSRKIILEYNGTSREVCIAREQMGDFERVWG